MRKSREAVLLLAVLCLAVGSDTHLFDVELPLITCLITYRSIRTAEFGLVLGVLRTTLNQGQAFDIHPFVSVG